MSKSIAITGAGSGLGRALARRFAADGHTLFLLGRNRDKLDQLSRDLPRSRSVVCDVSDPVSVKAAFAEIAQDAPQLDVLVNNAGSFEPSMIRDASDAHIQALLNTNLAGPMYCSREALPLMEKGSHILSIGSETVVVPVAMLAIYQSTKAGLERFSKTLDQEVAPLGIRVTLVRAGKMYEPGMEAQFAQELYQQWVDENLKLGRQPTGHPLSHYSSVADTIASLLHLPDDVHIPEIMIEGRHA